VFYHYYMNVTFSKWQNKTNPKFPSPEKVRDEIVQTMKGMYTATMVPSVTLYLASINSDYSQAYCSANPLTDEEHGGAVGVLKQFLIIVLVSDFWEWGYHRLGHVYPPFWQVHKHHHVSASVAERSECCVVTMRRKPSAGRTACCLLLCPQFPEHASLRFSPMCVAHQVFFNPSPFAVIADEYVDQFFRALPLLLFPMLYPINMDVMFFTYGLFFYAYGVYLHWGYESDWLHAHNPIVNTSFQHYCHHAKAILKKPYHCGFFLKCWDQIMHQVSGSGIYPQDRCFCASCERTKGNRSLEKFKEVKVPNYGCLLTLEFWSRPGTFSGTSAGDTNDVLTEEEKFFNEKKGK